MFNIHRPIPLLALIALLLLPNAVSSQKLGVGRPATDQEINAWDITISPDGKNLPAGKGTVSQGEQIYVAECERCHGAKGTGGDDPPLAGGKGTLSSPKPLKTVGSYWPYATTIFDYVRRAMPYDNPGILSNDQVYAVTAYLLHLNAIIPANATLDRDSLPKVQMPNRDGFIPQPLPTAGPQRRTIEPESATGSRRATEPRP